MTALAPLHLVAVLAQNRAAAGRVFVWCAVLLVAAVGLGFIAWWLRRRLAAQDDSEPLPMGFSLSDLRTLHARGELTDEEFEHAKRRMVAGTRARLGAEPQTPAPPSAPPPAASPPPPDGGGIQWEDPPEGSEPTPGADSSR